MRKRKGATRSETNFNSASSCAEEEQSVQVELQHNQNENEGGDGEGFFACYLLASLNPRFKGHTYIGFISHFSKINFLSPPFIQSNNLPHPFSFFIHSKSGFMLLFL